MSTQNPHEAQDFIHAKTITDNGDALKLLTFPDGFSCYTHSSIEETELIYNEIFIKQEYLKHGLSLEDCHCVFDIGANIGLFTIFAKLRNKDLLVHAFEPIKNTYDVLVKNIELHGLKNVYPHNCALGMEDGTEKELTFYPHLAGNATAYPDSKVEIKRLLTEVMGKEQADFLFQSATTHIVKVRTLSSIIEEVNVSSLDFLKIDVEGSELAVLNGISVEHFQRIRQVAAEIHSGSILEEAQSILSQRGFTIFSDTGIVGGAAGNNVYAIRQ
jgi:FkbM family methyltransferase